MKHFYSFTWKTTPRPQYLYLLVSILLQMKFPCPNVYTYFSKNVNLLGSKDCTKPWLVLRSGELQSIPMEILVNFLVSQARYYIKLSDPTYGKREKQLKWGNTWFPKIASISWRNIYFKGIYFLIFFLPISIHHEIPTWIIPHIGPKVWWDQIKFLHWWQWKC